MDWQPIETAPRDGTLVLLTCEGADYSMTGSCDHPNGLFGDARDGDVFEPQPTLWFPIPLPPHNTDASGPSEGGDDV